MHLGDLKPEIEYPCSWTYRIIGVNVAAIETAAANATRGLSYALHPSHKSRTGRYCSMVLEVTVTGDNMRKEIYARLLEHSGVVAVL